MDEEWLVWWDWAQTFITLKSVFYQIFCFKKKRTKKEIQINAHIIAKNHINYAHSVNNFLRTNSVKCLRDLTKPVVKDRQDIILC